MHAGQRLLGPQLRMRTAHLFEGAGHGNGFMQVDCLPPAARLVPNALSRACLALASETHRLLLTPALIAMICAVPAGLVHRHDHRLSSLGKAGQAGCHRLGHLRVQPCSAQTSAVWTPTGGLLQPEGLLMCKCKMRRVA
jgi:hypothetical protein